jgi:hypothetical protein
VTAAVVTYTNGQPEAPTSAVFDINGQQQTVAMADQQATVHVASSTPGDVILVKCQGLSVTIRVNP